MILYYVLYGTLRWLFVIIKAITAFMIFTISIDKVCLVNFIIHYDIQ